MMNFEVEGKKYKLEKLTFPERRELQRQYNLIYQEELKNGDSWFMTDARQVAKQMGQWSDEKDAELELLRKQIIDLQNKLDEGGYELEEAKQDAEKLAELRNKMVEFQSPLFWFQNNSIEGKAQGVQSDYEIFLRLKNERGKRYCKSFDEYLNKRDEGDPVVNVAFIYYSLGDDNPLDKLPENEFLREYFPEEFEGKDKDLPKPKEKKPFLKGGKPVEK